MAESKYMGHGVSVHRERGVHSMGYVRSGDECAHGVGSARDTGGAQRYQGMRMGAGGAWHELRECRKVSLLVRGTWVPVCVHRGVSVSGTCWGCDCVCVGTERGRVHPVEVSAPFWAPPAQCQGSSAAGPMPLEEQWMWLWLPSMGPPCAPCLGFSTSPPGLGTQIVPTSLEPSLQCSGIPYLCGVLLGRGSPIWELCSGLAGCPAPLGTGGWHWESPG